MSKPVLRFFIEGAEISADEMGAWVAGIITWPSERSMEEFAKDASHAIFTGVGRKVTMAREAQARRDWVKRNPPNHAGYYLCHICAGWVHENEAELDEIEPRSYRRGEDPLRDDNRRMAHAWPQHDPSGKVVCIGNRGKGSRQIESKTLEIRPPDMEC